jgi:hypothetical protein
MWYSPDAAVLHNKTERLLSGPLYADDLQSNFSN